MELDVRTTYEVSSSLEQAINIVTNALDSEWNDSVHESFYGFIDDIANTGKEFIATCDEIKAIASRVADVDVSKMQNVLDNLNRNAHKEK